jgi:predicted transcriptional regulator
MSVVLSPVVVRKLGQVGIAWKKRDNTKALEEILAFLKRNKDHISGAHYIVTNGMVPLIMRSQQRETLPACTTHLKVVSLGLKKKCILRSTDWKKEQLQLMYGRDPKGIDHVFLYMLNESETDPVISHFEDEFLDWVKAKVAAAGDRASTLKLRPDGVVDWVASGLFYLGHLVDKKAVAGVDDSGYYTHAIHRFCKELMAVLPAETVDTDWHFECNYTVADILLQSTKELALNVTSLLKKQMPLAFQTADRISMTHQHRSKKQQGASLKMCLTSTGEALLDEMTDLEEEEGLVLSSGAGTGSASSASGAKSPTKTKGALFASPVAKKQKVAAKPKAA